MRLVGHDKCVLARGVSHLADEVHDPSAEARHLHHTVLHLVDVALHPHGMAAYLHHAVLHPSHKVMDHVDEVLHLHRKVSHPVVPMPIKGHDTFVDAFEAARALLKCDYASLGTIVGAHPRTVSTWIHHRPPPPTRLLQMMSMLEAHTPGAGVLFASRLGMPMPGLTVGTAVAAPGPALAATPRRDLEAERHRFATELFVAADAHGIRAGNLRRALGHVLRAATQRGWSVDEMLAHLEGLARAASTGSQDA